MILLYKTLKTKTHSDVIRYDGKFVIAVQYTKLHVNVQRLMF